MKRLLIAASLSLAVAVFPAVTDRSTAVAAPINHSRTPVHRSGCPRLFTLAYGERYVTRVYRGTRRLTLHQRHRLWHVVRCQHTAHHRWVLHRYIDRSWAANRHRRYEARHPFHQSVVSWYYDDGLGTASGHNAAYGVADCGTDGVCYPFGTHIEFCLHGCVTATVDDHGPYVAGRDYDLDEATARAIGFSGVGSVAWRVVH